MPGDCRECGLCCHSASSAFVRVTGADWARLGPRAEELAHFVGHRAYMRMTAGRCAALEVRRGDADEGRGGGDFFCTIYAQRPQICRDLARGSPECAGEIETKRRRVLA